MFLELTTNTTVVITQTYTLILVDAQKRVYLPEPVLPTMPTFSFGLIVNDTSFNTSGRLLRYRMQALLNLRRNSMTNALKHSCQTEAHNSVLLYKPKTVLSFRIRMIFSSF